MTPRRLLFASAALLLASIPARADVVQDCVNAAHQGQRHRETGALRAARREFLACSASTCPTLVRTDCGQWLTDVEQRMPGLVVRATDENGQDLIDVRVLVDGTLEQERLEGRPLLVDPGARILRFERAGSKPVTMRVVVREGEKTRLVDVVMRAAASAGEKPRTFPVLPVVLGAIGVLGIAGFAYFAADGSSDVDRLRSSCAPRCAESDVDDARRKIIVANVSLGVGLVSLGAAAWLLLGGREPPPVVRVAF
jgi:hypothetical protein